MRLTSTQKMGFAALIMAGSVLLSRFMGLARDKVVSWQFGAGAEADVYFAAFVVPDFINYLLAGGYISITLIPLLSKRFEEDPEDGWRFFSAVFWWVTLAILALTAVAWLFAPTLAGLVGPGFSGPEQERLAFFLRIILPAQVFFLPGACVSALLYIRKQFFAPALTPLIYNGCIIAGGLLLPDRGMEGFCWGVLAGAALGAFLLPVAAARAGKKKNGAQQDGLQADAGIDSGLRLSFVLRHPMLKRLLLLALPLMIGVSVVVLDEQFVRVFGSLAGEGAVSLLNYARRIMLVPVGVVAQAAGVASYPFLASLAAKGDTAGFDGTLHTALRGSLLIVLPLTGYMIAVAQPTLGLIFEGGRFSAQETNLAAPLLQLMLVSVPFWVVQQVLGRAFYARQDTITPAVVGTLASFAVLPVYPFAVRHLGTSGVALLTTVSISAYTLALLGLWKRKQGGAAFAGLLRLAGKNLLLVLPCALLSGTSVPLVHSLLQAGFPAMFPFFVYGFTLAGSLVAFVLPYLALTRVFMPEALRVRRRTDAGKAVSR